MQTDKQLDIAFDISREELPIFLAEVDEHLQLLDNSLLRLQNEETNAELVQTVFRSAHTIKGMAGMIGHRRMTDVTHALENALDGVRKGSITLSTLLLNLCLEAVDSLRLLRDEVATSRVSDVGIEDVVSALKQLVEQKSETVLQEVRLEEEDKTEPAVHQDGTFHIHAKIDETAMASAARAFQLMMALQDLGEIRSMEPGQREIESAASVGQFEAVLVSDQPFDRVVASLTCISGVDEISINDRVVLSNGNPVSVLAKEKDGTAQPQVPDGEAGSRQPARERRSADPVGRRVTDLTLRMNVEHVDNLMNLVGELVSDRNHLQKIRGQILKETGLDGDLEQLFEVVTHLGRITDQLQEQVMKIRMLPIGSVFNKFPRMVHDMAQKVGKSVNVILHGEETEMDRSMIDEIYDPLIHLIRNSVDHGIEAPDARLASGKPEAGTVTLTARHEQGRVIITVADDGRGIDGEKLCRKAIQKGLLSEEEAAALLEQQRIELMFLPGLTTVEQVTEFSGRGVGLDIVRTNIQHVNGTIQIETHEGQGTQFKIVLPLTLAIVPSLLVKVQHSVFALPMVMITETLRLERSELKFIDRKPAITLRGSVLPLVPLGDVFKLPRVENENKRIFIVVIQSGEQQAGVIVDSLIGEEEVVVKSLGAFVGDVPGISSATILGNGQVALIVDVFNLFVLAAS